MKFWKPILLAPLVFLTVAATTGHAATNGPTIVLRDQSSRAIVTPVAEFMYFVPLISPAPVASLVSPAGAQSVRVTSIKRRHSGASFTADCEMEVNGDGWQRSVFDLSAEIRRHARKLERGETLKRQLKSIDVDGAGCIDMEVRGGLSNEVPTVDEVRLHFNGRGRTSPVWIRLCDVCRTGGNIHSTNEIIARVNTLTFRRQEGKPKMEVTVAAIKPGNAGNGLWQNFKGAVEGFAANLFIPPLAIEPAGNSAMLDFGGALVSGAPTFTFPRAKNLLMRLANDGLNDSTSGSSVTK